MRTYTDVKGTTWGHCVVCSALVPVGVKRCDDHKSMARDGWRCVCGNHGTYRSKSIKGMTLLQSCGRCAP